MKNKIKYLPISILTLTTALSGVALSSAGTFAAGTGSKPAAVTVNSSCNYTSTTATSVDLGLSAGNSVTTESTADKKAVVTCNNPAGFQVQAVGFSPDADHSEGLEGNTALYASTGTIPTGTSGTNSYWAFKAANVISTTTATVAPEYVDYAEVPSTPTTIVTYSGTTSNTIFGAFRTDYKVYAAPSQPAGSYRGAVKYIIYTGA